MRHDPPLTVADGVASITLNRPEMRDALLGCYKKST